MDYSNAMSNYFFRLPRKRTAAEVAECLTESLFTRADTWAELWQCQFRDLPHES